MSLNVLGAGIAPQLENTDSDKERMCPEIHIATPEMWSCKDGWLTSGHLPLSCPHSGMLILAYPRAEQMARLSPQTPGKGEGRGHAQATVTCHLDRGNVPNTTLSFKNVV